MKKLYFLISLLCSFQFANAQLTLVSFTPSTTSPGDFVAIVQASSGYFNGIHEYDSLTNYIDAINNGNIVYTAFQGPDYSFDATTFLFTIDNLPANTQFLNFADADGINYAQINMLGPLSVCNSVLYGQSGTNCNSLNWSINTCKEASKMQLLYSADNINFQIILDGIEKNVNQYAHYAYNGAISFYRLKATTTDGTIAYSNTIKVQNNVNESNDVQLIQNPINANQNGALNNFGSEKKYIIYNYNGNELSKGSLPAMATNIQVQTTHLPVGNYLLVAYDADVKVTIPCSVR